MVSERIPSQPPLMLLDVSHFMRLVRCRDRLSVAQGSSPPRKLPVHRPRQVAGVQRVEEGGSGVLHLDAGVEFTVVNF